MKKLTKFNDFLNEYTQSKGELPGAGYKDKETAEKTVKMLDDVKKKDHSKAMSMAVSWEIKAKEHPHKTPDMDAAAKVFRAWIDANKKTNEEHLDEGKGRDEAQKIIQKLRSGIFKKLSDEELEEFRAEIALALDLNESLDEDSRGNAKMAFGQLERIIDLANMLRERTSGIEDIPAWAAAKVTLAEHGLEAVYGYMDGADGVVENLNEADSAVETRIKELSEDPKIQKALGNNKPKDIQHALMGAFQRGYGAAKTNWGAVRPHIKALGRPAAYNAWGNARITAFIEKRQTYKTADSDIADWLKGKGPKPEISQDTK